MIHKHRATLSFAPNFAYALSQRAKPEQIADGTSPRCGRSVAARSRINPDTMRASSRR